MTFRLQYAAISDVGRVRKDNQDSGYAGPWVLTVCDGVGGAARGDIASSTAVQQLRRLDEKPTDDLLGQVAGALHRAHDRIGELVDEDPALNGTSTTATVALFDGTRLGMGHVGDSRAYLFRDNAITQLTKDHTFVQTLIDEGRITEDEARVHPHRNLILKAIDGIHEAEPDLFHVELAGRRPDPALQRRRQRRARRRPARRHPLHRHRRLRRRRAGPRQPRGRQHRQRHLHRRRRASRPTTPTPRRQEPMLVGAAADLRRKRGGMGGLFRGHRSGDTGELEAVNAEIPDDVAVRDPDRPDRPGGGALRPAPAATASSGSSGCSPSRSWSAWSGSAWPRPGPGASSQYYVGEDGGVVTIYRGLNADLPGHRAVQPVRDHQRRGRPALRLRRRQRPRGHRRRQPRRRPPHRREPRRAPEHRRRPPTRPRADMAQNSTLMGFVHRRRRGAELFLLVLALAVGIGAYAAVGLGVEGEVPPDILAYGGWLAAPGHRRAHRRPDHRAVRRPGAAAGRRRAQRPRPGRDPPARPGLRGRRPRSTTSRSSS